MLSRCKGGHHEPVLNSSQLNHAGAPSKVGAIFREMVEVAAKPPCPYRASASAPAAGNRRGCSSSTRSRRSTVNAVDQKVLYTGPLEKAAQKGEIYMVQVAHGHLAVGQTNGTILA